VSGTGVDPAAFAAEARAFLDAHAERLPEVADAFEWGRGDDFVGIVEEGDPAEQVAALSAAQAWAASRFDAGFGWIDGPSELGGRELGTDLVRLYRGLESGYLVPDQSIFTIGLGMVAPTILAHANPEVQRAYLPGLHRGDLIACQLFSEPGAGSDLASLAMRATRVEGGWVLNGQKVWTSMAGQAQWGICLARTAPDRPKHDGISCFMVDMHTPGIDIRPLRELTGAEMFNEVFFDDVFVPEDCLVGAEHDGWRCARTTLANERVFMGGSNTIGGGVLGVLRAVEARGLADDHLTLADVGDLAVTGHALAVLGFRMTLQSLAGADPSGSEAAVRKLLGVQQDQRVQEVGMWLMGPDAAATDGEAAAWSSAFLFNRCLTIAGGTSDVQRNVIAERLLGLPRDPEPGQ